MDLHTAWPRITILPGRRVVTVLAAGASVVCAAVSVGTTHLFRVAREPPGDLRMEDMAVVQ